MTEDFENYLRGLNLSENTIHAYLSAIRQFENKYGAVNCYLESIGRVKWKQTAVKVQQKAFLENVISEADYEYFKTRLKEDGEMLRYFVIRFMAATGASESELILIKAEHVLMGYLDLYSKGGKLRRIYTQSPAGGSKNLAFRK